MRHYIFAITSLVCLLTSMAHSNAVVTNSFTGDPRMARNVTLCVHDITLLDFFADLEQQTGIRYFVDESLQSERITYFVHDQPLSKSLTTLTAFFHFQWDRLGKPGSYSYRLSQTAEERKKEELITTTSADSREKATMDEIKGELQAWKRLKSLPPDQLKQRLDLISSDIASSRTSAERESLQQESAVIRSVQKMGDAVRVLLGYLQSLNDLQLREKLERPPATLYWPDRTGIDSIPDEAIKGVEVIDRVNGRIVGNAANRIAQILIRMHSLPGTTLRLQWNVTLLRLGSAPYDTYSGVFPLRQGSLIPLSSNNVEPADWQKNPAMTVPVILTPAPGDAGTISLGEQLDRLNAVCPINLITDCFWRSRLKPQRMQGVPLGQAITQIANLTDHHWDLQDGFIRVQSQTYAALRSEEPPADKTAKWLERDRTETWTMETFAEMVNLPDPQYNAFKEMVQSWPITPHMDVLDTARPHLRLWYSLSPAQRQSGRNQGVLYDNLNAAQKKLFKEGIDTSPYMIGRKDTSLQGAKCVFYNNTESGWGFRRDGRMFFTNQASREESLRYLYEADGQMDEKSVKPYSCVSITFTYLNSNQITVGLCSFMYYQAMEADPLN